MVVICRRWSLSDGPETAPLRHHRQIYSGLSHPARGLRVSLLLPPLGGAWGETAPPCSLFRGATPLWAGTSLTALSFP